MLAHLYHAEEVCGTATVGSSEAILLGGLAMKRRWQARSPQGPPEAHNLSLQLGAGSCWAAWLSSGAGRRVHVKGPRSCHGACGNLQGAPAGDPVPQWCTYVVACNFICSKQVLP